MLNINICYITASFTRPLFIGIPATTNLENMNKIAIVYEARDLMSTLIFTVPLLLLSLDTQAIR